MSRCVRRRVKFTYVKATVFTLFFCLLALDGYKRLEMTGDNWFHVSLNGVEIGTVGSRETAERLLVTARREMALEQGELTFVEADLEVAGEEILWGKLDDEEIVLGRMKEVLQQNVLQTMHHSYSLKVNEYTVNLSSAEDVRSLLQAAVNKYDKEEQFRVELKHEREREFNVLTAEVQETKSEKNSYESFVPVAAGVETVFACNESAVNTEKESDFADYTLGLKSMDFAEKVEIVEVYLPESQLTALETAVEEVIKEQETPREYTIAAGDTLSEISIKLNIPMDRLLELNSDKLTDENSMIRQGDRLIVTVPEPELSVERTECNYYEETYDADIVYIENNNWYTNQSVVHQQPSSGFRKIVANVFYRNDREVSRDILKEEVLLQAVAKVVERGTKIPPTYVKPISGGRLSSGFGKRTAPTKGASTYHKGVDWAVPTGTAVYASCGGTVSKAGWGSGYGYVVYIDHEDGRQTRYGHLSKVLVKAGQTVKQGEKIALSGNTGVSTGPHLHFEILIGGSQVNPLKYLN